MVQFYTEQEIITPEIDNTPGRGRLRKYSEKNIVEFVIIKELDQCGVALSTIKVFFEYLRDVKGNRETMDELCKDLGKTKEFHFFVAIHRPSMDITFEKHPISDNYFHWVFFARFKHESSFTILNINYLISDLKFG